MNWKKHNYYMVVFRQPGIGTPLYFETREELMSEIEDCLTAQYPFHVGHEFRMTLNDGNKRIPEALK